MVNSLQKTSLVLIADADAELRSTLRKALEAQNLTVIETVDSENCLANCRRLRPDLLLLSSNLPGALDLCETLKTTRELQHTRILAVLTSDDDVLLDRFFEAGVDDCIVMPLRLLLLTRRTQRLLQHHFLRDEVEFQRDILSQMADAVVAVDANGRVMYWNTEAERAYDIRSEDIIGRPLDEAYRIEGFTTEQRTVVVTTAAQDVWRGEGVHIKHSGQRVDVEVTVRSLQTDADLPSGHITVIRNIGERKRIEAALRDEREVGDAMRDTVAALARTLD